MTHQQPGDPNAYHPHYFGQQHLYAQPARGNWAAVTGLVLGVIALLLAFLPIINNFAFLLALVGLVFGVVGVVGTRNGRRTGRGMAVTSVVLSVLAVVGVLASQAWYAKAANDFGKAVANAPTTAETTAQVAAAPAPTPTSIPGNGTFLVGDEITPGTYRSIGAAKRAFSFCGWSRLRDTSGDLDAVLQAGSAKVNDPVIVTIRKTDGAFKSSGCETWTKIK